MRIRQSSILILGLVIAAVVLSLLPDGWMIVAQKFVGSDVDSSEFVLTIESDKSVYEIGETPTFTATLINRSDKNVVLLPALDGSGFGRYPLVQWSIEAPPDALPLEQLGRCGNVNPLKSNDFRAVAPGESFDVAGTWGRMPVRQLDRGAGEYVVRLTYATDEVDLERWLWFGFKRVDYLQEIALLEKVPRIRLESNTLTIRIENPFDSPEDMLRSGTPAQAMIALRQMDFDGYGPGAGGAIIDALTRLAPENANDFQYWLFVDEAMRRLKIHATPEDVDQVWELFRKAAGNGTLTEKFGHQDLGPMQSLAEVLLRSRPTDRYDRLAYFFLGTTSNLPGVASSRPMIRASNETIERLIAAGGEDIDRLLERLLTAGGPLDRRSRSAIESALRANNR